jgi:hypothetical protein
MLRGGYFTFERFGGNCAGASLRQVSGACHGSKPASAIKTIDIRPRCSWILRRRVCMATVAPVTPATLRLTTEATSAADASFKSKRSRTFCRCISAATASASTAANHRRACRDLRGHAPASAGPETVGEEVVRQRRELPCQFPDRARGLHGSLRDCEPFRSTGPLTRPATKTAVLLIYMTE